MISVCAARGASRRGVLVLALGCLLALPAAAAAAPSLPPLQHLQPGEFADVHQDVPVTVVFVGLETGSGPTGIDTARMLAPQLSENRVVDRTTRFYERAGILGGVLEPAKIGLTYNYDYRTVFADGAFEDAFFDHLTSIGLGPIPGGTFFQQAYAEHPLAAQQIPASLLIDATAAERWLAANAGPMLGIDTTRPTVFFVNWFGRPDFQFHTYGFLGQRPGAPFPNGFTHQGQMVAWGGSPASVPYGALGRDARVWLYDVSAGPDYGTANWLLEPADFDGDGVTDERIPPVWEYGTDHWFRPFDDLTGDLAKLLRFVAVDELFGSTPIYDPSLSEPLLADRVELDLNLFAGRPGRDPLSTLRAGDLPSVLGRLDPTRSFPLDLQVRPLSGEVARVYDCQQSSYTATPKSCYGNRVRFDDPNLHDSFYDLWLFFGDQHNSFLDGTRYEVPLAVFDVPEDRLSPRAIAGVALSRTPNLSGWTFGWLADRHRAFGYTDTGLVGHEIGHHLGLSHVHDTYDPVLDRELESTGPFAFLFSGTESYTSMSYLTNTDEFGQFDRDHMARWQLAARLDNANRILGDIARSPRAARASSEAVSADARAGAAIAALNAWNLPAAASAAADAYRLVLIAAAKAGVKVEPYSGVADQAPGAGVIDAATDPRDLKLPMPDRLPANAVSLYGP